MIRRRVIVSGRVQGVWFRDRCQREARRLDVRGWVRNRSDGTVEAVFEGAPDEVLTMVNWAASGPERARVTGVEVLEEDVQGEPGFRIR
jgi:acylphosphatase